ASAASVAGVAKLARAGYFDDAPTDAAIVCTLTGHGLKDPDRAIAVAEPPTAVAPELAAVERALGLPPPR
ncbi:MAG: threonine synthase, partial [Dehalococcoidia bacterium]